MALPQRRTIVTGPQPHIGYTHDTPTHNKMPPLKLFNTTTLQNSSTLIFSWHLLAKTSQPFSICISHLISRQVFDDVCTELAMAILQFFQGKPPEEQVFRCMKALNKFCTIAHRDVPQLVKMIGPEPSKFAGMSPRVDELVEAISARLATVPMF